MTVTTEKHSQRGRPKLPPGKRKLPSMGFRPTPDLRAELERAAGANERSLSHEIEARLEWSFIAEGAERAAFGGEHVDALMRVLGNAVRLIEAGSGSKWQEDRKAFTWVKATIEKLLDALGPAAGAYTDGEQGRLGDVIGKMFVSEFLKKVSAAGAYTDDELGRVADDISKTIESDFGKKEKKEG